MSGASLFSVLGRKKYFCRIRTFSSIMQANLSIVALIWVNSLQNSQFLNYRYTDMSCSMCEKLSLMHIRMGLIEGFVVHIFRLNIFVKGCEWSMVT